MKILTNFSKSLSLLLTAFCISFAGLAQEKKVDVDINTNSDNGGFWTQPWVWVVGGAIFILLLVALLRGGKKD